uniref:Uncharacterized protein n=1 Tax=viral metagenome TaxID=1070528 RepID=A0A6C0I859_9ZZZZ
MRKCPPGVLCIENMTSMLFIIILIIVGYFVYISFNKQSQNQNQNQNQNPSQNQYNVVPNYPYNNLNNGVNLYDSVRNNMFNDTPINNVLTNPYEAPYKDERYMVPSISRQVMPINVSTNVGAVDTSYRQIGILTPLNGVSNNNILPLMGRPLFTSRQKWQYYTISNQHNNVKLPVSVKGKSALNDYGVDEVYNGDTVYVEGYNDAFKATVYESSTIKYLPVF